MFRSFAFVTTLTLLSPLCGCQGGANPFAAFDPQAQAMAALSEQAKTAAKGYLTGLNGVVATVADAKDFSSAISAVEKLTPYFNDMSTYLPKLQSLDAKDLENVRVAFGPELKKSEADFKAQLERLTGSGTIGSVLKPVLEQVKIFQ